MVSLVIFSSLITSAQIGFSNPNYEVLFKNNLRRGFLNLAGKKIGDKGLLILLQQDFLGDLKKLDLRYNQISALGAKQLANSTSFKKLKTLILMRFKLVVMPEIRIVKVMVKIVFKV